MRSSWVYLVCSASKSMRDDLTAVYNFLKRGSGEGFSLLFFSVSGDRTHGSGLKLHQRKFRLELIGKSCSLRGLSSTGTISPGKTSWLQACWCSRSVCTMVLDIWFNFQVALCGAKSWTQWFSWVPSSSGYSMILDHHVRGNACLWEG